MEGDSYLLYVITATVLFMICMILGFRAKAVKGVSWWLLTGYFWCFFLTIAISFIVLSPYIVYVPHLFRLANIPFLLMMPFSWLYFRNTLRGGGLYKQDLLHLIPALIYIVDFLPFFMLSGDEKLTILRGLDRYGLKGAYAEGWFMPSGWHNVIRFLTAAGYWAAQWKLMQYYKTAPVPQRRKWLEGLLYTELFIFLPAIIILVSGRIDLYNLVVNMFCLLVALIQGYMLLMKPEILYGFPAEPYVSSGTLVEEKDGKYIENLEKGRTPRPVDDALVGQIKKSLGQLMDENHLFLDPELKLFHLAERIGVPTYKLSVYFNDYEKMNFYEFINHRRIEFCIAKIHSGEARLKTVEALSVESGFNSRTTFIRAFKKVTGKTPSDFMHDLN